MSGSERRAPGIGELLGVEVDAQAISGGRLEQPLDLRRSERDLLAKGVDTGGEAKARDSWQQLLDCLADVRFSLAPLRQSVKREQGRDDTHRLLRAEAARDVEQADFAGDVAAVTRLDLDRGAPPGHQRAQPSAGAVEEFRSGGRPGCSDGRGDPPAGARNLFVARSGAAHRMFACARAAEHEMRVAID